MTAKAMARAMTAKERAKARVKVTKVQAMTRNVGKKMQNHMVVESGVDTVDSKRGHSLLQAKTMRIYGSRVQKKCVLEHWNASFVHSKAIINSFLEIHQFEFAWFL